MQVIPGCRNIRIASRTDQRIIMLNQGDGHGFMVCKDCGAAMPGREKSALDGIDRPYKSRQLKCRCRHTDPVHVDLGYDFVTDMVVLEFALDEDMIDTDTRENPWIGRAAQTFAEALRLAVSQGSDIDFTELVTGYRLRRNPLGFFVDIYLYDSLSSGAGYAASVSGEIDTVLTRTWELLSGCKCDSACHACLKHYQNQHIHGMLDRFAALELLRWGKEGILAEALSLHAQQKLIGPLENILARSGCSLTRTERGIMINGPSGPKQLVVYPSMWIEPWQEGTIFVSDALIRSAKPFAVRKIVAEAGYARP